MPNQPRADNPARSVRIDDELWAAVVREAEGTGRQASSVIRLALEEYLGRGRVRSQQSAPAADQGDRG